MAKALSRHRIEQVESLLDNDPFLVKGYLEGWREPILVFAVRSRCPVDIYALLLRRGACVDEPGMNGLTALANMVASSGDRSMRRGGVEVSGVFGQTMMEPFYSTMVNKSDMLYDGRAGLAQLLAASERVVEEYLLGAVRCFLQHGADPQWTDILGISVVEYAQRAGRLQVVKMFEDFEIWKDIVLKFRLGIAPVSGSLSRRVFQFLIPNMFAKNFARVR
jgi:hypothetical protein